MDSYQNRNSPTPSQADQALEQQEEDVPVEVLPDGTIRPVQQSSRPDEKKTTLRDPKGEYAQRLKVPF